MPAVRASCTTISAPLSSPRTFSSANASSTLAISANLYLLAVEPKLARRLRTAQHQQAQQYRLRFAHAEAALKVVLEARHPARTGLEHQALLLERVNGGLGLRFGQVHHRVTAGFLVAAEYQGVERERIAVGHGAGLLHQGGQYAGFLGGKWSHGDNLRPSMKFRKHALAARTPQIGSWPR